MRGVLIFMLASVITVTSQDIAIIYLPLMGIERGIDVGRIGVVLTLRAVAAMVSRIFYARLLATFGRIPLMIGSLALSGAGCIGLALPVPIWGLYVASSLMGLGLGIATTLSITSLMAISPVEARATLNSVRITGNRVGQVTLPLLAGIVAAGTGAGGVMAVTGLAILAVGVATHLDRKR
jgi:MFS family permease